MNIYLIFVLALLILDYVLDSVADALNVRHAEAKVPSEFEGWFDAERYAKAQRYLRENTRFDYLTGGVTLVFTVVFILAGGFRFCDDVARSAGLPMIGTGVLFAVLLVLLSQLAHLPFSLYHTFVIEERFGFNRTTLRTFLGDQVKGLLMSWLLGGAVFAAVLWFFSHAGPWAWAWSWGAVVLFQLLLTYVAPIVILPLFNKFIPINEGSLKSAIERYVKQEGFRVGGIFTMDGSRRSTKSNAYFTGLGRWRRIVLFDTLIEKHSEEELVSVLAHEVGHYKLRHIPQHLLLSMASTGVMFYLLSLFISRPGLYEAFGVTTVSIGGQFPIYAGMVFFAFLYAPINIVLGLLQSILSRRHEFEADAFAVRTAGDGENMVQALKRLSVDNLSNLTPHPVKVFLEYSHPPVLARIAAIRSASRPSQG